MDAKIVGERIRELRKSKGLTQAEFAEKCDISRSSLARYETGVNIPDPEILRKIAQSCGVSYDYLLGNETAELPKISDDDIKFALFGDVSNITDAQFEEVKQFARFIKERAARDNK